jgi:hypothetical protein
MLVDVCTRSKEGQHQLLNSAGEDPVKKVPAHLGKSLHSMTQTTPMRDMPAAPPAIGENESPPIHHLRIKVSPCGPKPDPVIHNLPLSRLGRSLPGSFPAVRLRKCPRVLELPVVPSNLCSAYILGQHYRERVFFGLSPQRCTSLYAAPEPSLCRLLRAHTLANRCQKARAPSQSTKLRARRKAAGRP